MEFLADESLAVTLGYLPKSSLLHLARASTRLLSVARVDILWLPLIDSRWRFGSVPSTDGAGALAPGARSAAAAGALADAVKAPLSEQAQAFAFFLERCRFDAQVAAWVLQLDATNAPGPDHASLPPGSLVEIRGLNSSTQFNTCRGVVAATPESEPDRHIVRLLTSLERLRIKEENLVLIERPSSAADIEASLRSSGAQAIDALARLSSRLPSESTVGVRAMSLLAALKEQWAVWQWQALVADSQRVDLLEEGGLVVSQWADPEGADVAACRRMLAELAEAAAARASAGAPLMERVEAVGAVLSEYNFAGNLEDYYDPKNSFLHNVLSRRLGIPISLSIVWAAVARRLSVPCFLCASMPAHIIIRVSTGGVRPDQDLYVDAFGREVMDFSGLLRFAHKLGLPSFREEFVAQHPATAVYARLLRNLTNIYRQGAQNENTTKAGRLKACYGLMGTCSQAIAVADRTLSSECEHLEKLREQVEALATRMADRALRDLARAGTR